MIWINRRLCAVAGLALLAGLANVKNAPAETPVGNSPVSTAVYQPVDSEGTVQLAGHRQLRGKPNGYGYGSTLEGYGIYGGTPGYGVYRGFGYGYPTYGYYGRNYPAYDGGHGGLGGYGHPGLGWQRGYGRSYSFSGGW